MYCFAVAVVSLAVSVGIPQKSVSDPQGVLVAQQSVAALTSGNLVNDVTLNAKAISVLGSDGETGTATLSAKGTTESRTDLTMNNWTRTEIRNAATGIPAGEWIKNGATPNSSAIHNSWTDTAWFFPALSSLTQTANPNFVFQSVGAELHNGVKVQHITVFQIAPLDTADVFNAAHLSTTEFYLDAGSSLPVAIAFKTHPDNDMNIDIPVEITFDSYQVVSGIQVPFHIQRSLNGTVVLDFTVTSALVNSGLSDAPFSF